MKTIKMNDIKFKNNELKEAIKLAIKNDFKIMVHIPDYGVVTWALFEDNSNVGYIQSGDFGHGVKFSTVHKPCKECGTGFGLNEDAQDTVTIEDLKRCFIIAPNWANSMDVIAVRKYKGFDEYFKSPINQILKYTEVIK